MTNTQPVTEPLVPLWDDNAIIAAYQRAFDRYPDVPLQTKTHNRT